VVEVTSEVGLTSVVGLAVVPGLTVVVGFTEEVGLALVDDTTLGVVLAGDVAAVETSSPFPQLESNKTAATTGNQRLTFGLRCVRHALIPLRSMLRRTWVVGSLIIMALVGCSDNTQKSEAGAQFILSQDFPLPTIEPDTPVLPTTTTGADGVVVEVTDTSRIIVLNEAIAEIVVSLGMKDSIIGRDATTTLAALVDITEVSNGHDISAESVLALRPSVVIGDTRTGPSETLEQLRGAGVAVLIAPEVWTLSELPTRVEMIANALGIPRAGTDLINMTEQSIDAALKGVGAYATTPRVAFLYVRGTASVYLLGGSGSGADELVAATGAIDVGALNGLAAFTPLTAEAIVQADPDVLLVMTKGLDSVGGIDGLLELPGVSSTRAAASSAVIAVDDDLLLSFGPRTGALITRLAELLNTFSSDA
jgi:iron complex transport system substrate-binding protein